HRVILDELPFVFEGIDCQSRRDRGPGYPCRADEGIEAVDNYANPERESMHERLAEQATALNGGTDADTHFSEDKVHKEAKDSGADAIHPGYGFLAENADFAQAVIDAGIIWIGPPPSAIHALGDKVAARHLAQKVGAPLAPGTTDPVES